MNTVGVSINKNGAAVFWQLIPRAPIVLQTQVLAAYWPAAKPRVGVRIDLKA